ncbi:MAG: GNAT family N-acetyltransferase [Rhizobiaceae bacterium]
MAASPVFEEQTGGAAAAMMASLAGLDVEAPVLAQLEGIARTSPARRLSVYPAGAGFDLSQELEFLSWRAAEPNIFFNPRFMAPAMPRLEDREIRFMVMRDEVDDRSRMRLLMPFSVERPGLGIGPEILRAWSSPFAPLGTPLVDRDDPVGVFEDMLDILGRKHLKLPDVLVIPDIPERGPVASALRIAAIGRNLSIVATGRKERAMLVTGEEPDAYLRQAVTPHHLRGYSRLLRRLGELGEVTFGEWRDPVDVRRRTEEFLALETKGWKGRTGTAMTIDRYRAAFTREALYNLAERDMCRIHTLDLNGKAIASLIVMREAGVAYTWKTAYDEAFARYSPGSLLMIDTTKRLLDDPNIERADSLAVPDHPVMTRLWKERETMVTLLIGLTPGADRAVRQAASQIDLYKKTQNIARLLRDKIRSMAGKA